MKSNTYPASFPNDTQLKLLKAILSERGGFEQRWAAWKSSIDFERIDFGSMRLLPTLCLRMMKEKSFDDPLKGRIEGVYKMAWVKNQLLVNELKGVLYELKLLEVPSVLLKGVALLFFGYKNIGGRMMGDADIMVPQDRAVEVANMMLNRGWKYKGNWRPGIKSFDEKNILFFLRHSHHTAFENKRGQVIEIHWISPILTRGNVCDVALFWNNTQAIQINECSTSILCPELMFLHVCFHGLLFNRIPPFRWIVDAHKICEAHPEFDWAKLLDFGEKLGCLFFLKNAISYLVDVFDMKVPAIIMDQLESFSFTAKERREYYNWTKRDRTSFEEIALFWKNYRLNEPTKNSPKAIAGFLDYLLETYGFNRKRDLLWEVYMRRVSRKNENRKEIF